MNEFGGALLAVMSGIALMHSQFIVAAMMLFLAFVYLLSSKEKSAKK